MVRSDTKVLRVGTRVTSGENDATLTRGLPEGPSDLKGDDRAVLSTLENQGVRLHVPFRRARISY